MKRYSVGFLPGFILGLFTAIGCASVQYQYFTPQLPDECYDKGTLLGKSGSDGWPDMPMSECKPDAAVKAKCVVETTAEHFKKNTALQECEQALAECQKGPAPTPPGTI